MRQSQHEPGVEKQPVQPLRKLSFARNRETVAMVVDASNS